VAVFNFISESHGLSDHFINEIMNIIINDKKLLVVERYRVDAVYLRSFLRVDTYSYDFDDIGYIVRMGYKVGVSKKSK
jgi:hypothetical protein